MNLSVTLVLLVIAFVCVLASALGRAPLWIAVFMLCVIELLRVLPR